MTMTTESEPEPEESTPRSHHHLRRRDEAVHPHRLPREGVRIMLRLLLKEGERFARPTMGRERARLPLHRHQTINRVLFRRWTDHRSARNRSRLLPP